MIPEGLEWDHHLSCKMQDPYNLLHVGMVHEQVVQIGFHLSCVYFQLMNHEN